MKHTVKHTFLLGLLLFTALFSIVPSQVFAATGSIYFKEDGGTVPVNGSFSVDVRATAGATWGRNADVTVTFPSNLLQATSVVNGTFGDPAPTIGAGAITYKTSSFWARSLNDEMLFRITFKALAPGSATLSFTDNTVVNSGPTSKKSSTFILQAKSCPKGQVGTPPNCTTPTPSPSPTPKPSVSPTPGSAPKPSPKPSQSPSPITTTPTEPTPEETPTPTTDSDGGLKIENVKVTATRQTNSVVWTMNKDDVLPKVTYGIAKGNLTTEATVEKMSDDTYQVVFQNLKLGTLYYFAIKASTPDQLQAATYSGSITTRGYPVQLTIKQNGILAPEAKVKINDRSFTANKDAIILTELGEGKHEATITPSGSAATASAQFTVVKKQVPANGSPELQAFVLDAEIHDSEQQSDDSPIMAIAIGGGTLLAGGAGIIGFLLYKRRGGQQADNSAVDGDLLMASYGPAIENYRSQTPEPNLDARGAQVVTTAPLVSPEMPAAQVETVSQDPSSYQTLPQEYTVPPSMPEPSTAFDATSMPLPPVETVQQNAPLADPMTIQAATTPETTPLPPEQSPALLAVEAIEGPASTDDTQTTTEEAVYHAETGELEILHDHTPSVKASPPETVLPPTTPPPTTQTPPLTGSAS